MKYLKIPFTLFCLLFLMSATKYHKSFNYDNCYNDFDETMNQLAENDDLPEGFAYSFASDNLDECISGINEAAAIYWINH